MSGLDTYLSTLPGRCQHGRHLATMGCPACAEQGKARGQAIASAGDAEWVIFTAALRSAAVGGQVRQRHVRPLIRGRIEPKHIGLLYRRARREGLLVEIDRERSNDEVGRNTHHWEPIYELRGTA